MIYPAAVQAWETNTHQIPIHDLGAIPARWNVVIQYLAKCSTSSRNLR